MARAEADQRIDAQAAAAGAAAAAAAAPEQQQGGVSGVAARIGCQLLARVGQFFWEMGLELPG